MVHESDLRRIYEYSIRRYGENFFSASAVMMSHNGILRTYTIQYRFNTDRTINILSRRLDSDYVNNNDDDIIRNIYFKLFKMIFCILKFITFSILAIFACNDVMNSYNNNEPRITSSMVILIFTLSLFFLNAYNSVAIYFDFKKIINNSLIINLRIIIFIGTITFFFVDGPNTEIYTYIISYFAMISIELVTQTLFCFLSAFGFPFYVLFFDNGSSARTISQSTPRIVSPRIVSPRSVYPLVSESSVITSSVTISSSTSHYITEYKFNSKLIPSKGKTYVISDQNIGFDSKETATCAISTECYKDGDPIGFLRCKHHFYKDNIEKWFSYHSHTCPICRHCQDDIHPSEDNV